MEEDLQQMSDHDIIVSMHTTLKRAVEDLKALDMKVTDFNNSYVKREEVESFKKDHELRIRRLEMWGGIAIGLLYALNFYVNFIKK